MKMIVAAAFILALAAPAAGEPSTPVADAERWVALVDSGKYADSWAAAGSLFQRNVTGEAWAKAAAAAREPLGAVVARKLLKEQKSTSLPGVPDGDYDTIQFATAFANKKAAVETIVLAHEPGGWKVDGYFVR